MSEQESLFFAEKMYEVRLSDASMLEIKAQTTDLCAEKSARFYGDVKFAFFWWSNKILRKVTKGMLLPGITEPSRHTPCDSLQRVARVQT